MMNNILIIEYVKDTGSKDVKMVAMFNKRIITETEVKKTYIQWRYRYR